MDNPLLYALVGFLACFLGTIPSGLINLSVVKSTVDYDRCSGLGIAFAASLIEIIQALIAISFGMLIGTFLDSNVPFKFFLASVFIFLAAFSFTRKPEPTLQKEADKPSSFFRNGFKISALNPQAVPF